MDRKSYNISNEVDEGLTKMTEPFSMAVGGGGGGGEEEEEGEAWFTSSLLY